MNENKGHIWLVAIFTVPMVMVAAIFVKRKPPENQENNSGAQLRNYTFAIVGLTMSVQKLLREAVEAYRKYRGLLVECEPDIETNE